MVTETDTLKAESIIEQFRQCGFTHVVNLPDTESKFMYDAIAADSSIHLIPVCREGEAMAIAAGLFLTGKRPVVQIQNTGFFESGDSIRGICLEMKLPLVMIIGYRGYAGPNQEPRDSAARFLEPMLNTWDIPYYLVTSDANCHLISEANARAVNEGRTVAVLIGKEFE